jgi:hypothetical protein
MYKTYWTVIVFLISIITAIPSLANQITDKSIQIKIQNQYLFQSDRLNELQKRVISPNPSEWEYSTLQSIMYASNCLTQKPQYINASELTRQEFASILDLCFQGLESIANAKDPNRFIRENIDNLRELRDRSSLQLDKLNSKYIPYYIASAKGLVRILSASVDKSEVSIENIQALRYLIYKYKNIPVFEGFGCFYSNDRPFTRIEIARVLHQTLDKFNEFLSEGMADKIDKNDFPIIIRLQEEFAAEIASFSGLRALEPRIFPSFSEYLNIENTDYLEIICR